MTIKDLYLDVVQDLEQKADVKIAKRNKSYVKTSGYQSYGIRTPEFRKLVKVHKKRFQQMSLEEKFELGKMFFKSRISEQAAVGNTLVELSISSIPPRQFDFLDEILDYFNNWETTDYFCINILQPLLRKHPNETLNMLRKWNKAENTWKRRASVVAFVRKIGKTGEFVDEVLELCENLIWDKEDLVQKGVGWALKDNLRGAKERVLDYVKTLRRRGVPSTITLYAICELKGKEREEILKVKPSHM